MNLQLLPSVAGRELQTRRMIRQSLTEWCRHCGFEPAAHHRIIIAELEAVARGECDRLAIFLPPGSAKSTYIGSFDNAKRCLIGVFEKRRKTLLGFFMVDVDRTHLVATFNVLIGERAWWDKG
jgi:hypothetical protein